MTDDQFRQLCNVYGFAPSRALRELIDCVRAQEIAACAKVCDSADKSTHPADLADAIRARKDKQ